MLKVVGLGVLFLSICFVAEVAAQDLAKIICQEERIWQITIIADKARDNKDGTYSFENIISIKTQIPGYREEEREVVIMEQHRRIKVPGECSIKIKKVSMADGKEKAGEIPAFFTW